MVLAVILDIIRPYHPYYKPLAARSSKTLTNEVVKRLKANSPFIYWDYQNPLYVSIITIGLPIIMIIMGVIAGFSQIWVSVLLVVIGILMIIPHGGQRTLITRQEISVRWGILGLRVLRLKIPEIIEAELHEFSPLRDFGGYCIRFNREIKAYYLRGTQGVKITTRNNKKYLIGSDHPEQIHSVLTALIGKNK